MKYFIDTNIWRDYWEDRSDNFKPLGEFAFQLLKLIKQNKDKVLITEEIMEELSIKFDKKQINEIFDILKKEELLELITYNQEQLKEAKKLKIERKIPFVDALFAVLARDNKAILVSRDKHFMDLTDIVEVKKPEEII